MPREGPDRRAKEGRERARERSIVSDSCHKQQNNTEKKVVSLSGATEVKGGKG